jgi:hypothetical protein
VKLEPNEIKNSVTAYEKYSQLDFALSFSGLREIV